jgi:oleandomycin transport system ATP-binding protein
MRRRLDLAASLVGQPRMLYLDEPTTGLDPRSRTDVWAMIRGLVADGVTVLLTTQYLDEADQLAHDIVVIDRGKVIATGSPDELKAKTGGQVLLVAPSDPGRLAETAMLLEAVAGAEVTTDVGTGAVSAPVTDKTLLPRVVRELDDRGIELAEFTLRKASMDEVFFVLTGHRADEGQGVPRAREMEESKR